MPPPDFSTQYTPLAPSVEKAYYRKCIELKRRLNEVEAANDEYKIRRVRLDRAIMKMRLERAFLLEQLAKRMEYNVDGSDGSNDEAVATPPPDRPHRDKRRRVQPSTPSQVNAAPSAPAQPSSRPSERPARKASEQAGTTGSPRHIDTNGQVEERRDEGADSVANSPHRPRATLRDPGPFEQPRSSRDPATSITGRTSMEGVEHYSRDGVNGEGRHRSSRTDDSGDAQRRSPRDYNH